VGRTQHLGFNKFGAEGRISDEGYKFSLRDRELIDSILQSLLLHDHAPDTVGASLVGPPAGTPPTLTQVDTGGVLLAGRDYYYKISYVDINGNETEAAAAGLISTPELISAPTSQVLTTATTGGTLVPGTYKYAMAFFQTAGGVTTAPNTDAIVVPTGTSTNTVTIPLPTLPDGADGWRLYRKGPGDLEYWFLVSVASGPTEYVDDGSVNPDCTQKRPIANTTNSTNKITIDLPAGYLPLDTRIVGWRIYRTSTAGSYPANSLVATVVETTTEGGADLVTTYDDEGDALSLGIPLIQTAVPSPVAQIDASTAFAATSDRLPSALAPLGIRAFNLLLPGTLAAQDYHQFVPPHDMLVERVDGFYSGANPTGLTPSTDFVTLRYSDDAVQDEIQSLFNDAITQNEIQQLYNTATAGTFTLGDGVDTTDAIAFDATPATIQTRLETDIAAITTVLVGGAGTINDKWVIEWIVPGATNFVQLTVVDSLTGGSSFIATTVEGSDGGTFTLSDGTDTTSAIAFDAAGSVIKTRLETDITAFTTVTVTGAGTEADPWLIEYDNPGSQDLPLLLLDDVSLNGVSTITEHTKGHGITQVDMVIDQNQAGHFLQTATTEFGTQEAEDLPALGGALVSDTLALNDVAVELDAINETNHWQLPTLEAGEYTFRFWVSDSLQSSDFTVRVNDMTKETQSLYNNSSTGDFTISYDGQGPTGVIAWNAAASVVEAALELLSNINAVSVSGAGTVGDPWLIVFDDPAGNVAQITTNDAGMDGTSTIATDVAGTSTTLESLAVATERPVYTPAYELISTLDGTEIIQLEVEKTVAAGLIRVDKYEYAVLLPVLHGGSTVTVEVLVTGTPTTNGDDLQTTLWY